MKLRLRIGRRTQAGDAETDEVGRGGSPADCPQEPLLARAAEPPHVPLPRTPNRRVVRVGSFCRASDIGQTAVTDLGRAVLAVRAGHCGRWVYDDRCAEPSRSTPGAYMTT
ncbi:hypothetical protein GCM10009838_55760 [Catenulispora subtropica]|uniref:Uncharacterized protein n=1 Tax=Catenulispora subtropica TaxID=450798 RepID=A0ABP5DUU5_9ACTN